MTRSVIKPISASPKDKFVKKDILLLLYLTELLATWIFWILDLRKVESVRSWGLSKWRNWRWDVGFRPQNFSRRILDFVGEGGRIQTYEWRNHDNLWYSSHKRASFLIKEQSRCLITWRPLRKNNSKFKIIGAGSGICTRVSGMESDNPNSSSPMGQVLNKDIYGVLGY